MSIQYFSDPCSSFGVFGHHIEIAATTCTRKLIAKTVIVNLTAEVGHTRRFCARVKRLVLLPCLSDKLAILLEIAKLYRIEKVKRMLLHFSQKSKML